MVLDHILHQEPLLHPYTVVVGEVVLLLVAVVMHRSHCCHCRFPQKKAHSKSGLLFHCCLHCQHGCLGCSRVELFFLLDYRRGLWHSYWGKVKERAEREKGSAHELQDFSCVSLSELLNLPTDLKPRKSKSGAFSIVTAFFPVEGKYQRARDEESPATKDSPCPLHHHLFNLRLRHAR